jgi:predicted transcriptional regulator with HTH domain
VRESFLREFHIANIVKHAPKNVLASLWWLERRYPGEFALKNVHRPTENKKDELMVRMITETELIEMAKRAERIAKEAPLYGLP